MRAPVIFPARSRGYRSLCTVCTRASSAALAPRFTPGLVHRLTRFLRNVDAVSCSVSRFFLSPPLPFSLYLPQNAGCARRPQRPLSLYPMRANKAIIHASHKKKLQAAQASLLLQMVKFVPC